MNNLETNQPAIAELVSNVETLDTYTPKHITGPYAYVTSKILSGGFTSRNFKLCKVSSLANNPIKVEKDLATFCVIDKDGSGDIIEATFQRIADVLNTLEHVPNKNLPIVKMLTSQEGAWTSLIMYSHKLAVENQELKDWKAQAEIGHKLMKDGHEQTEQSLKYAREELTMIREYLNANPEESTYDEVVRHFEKLKNSK